MTGDFKEINGLKVSSFRAECNVVENHGLLSEAKSN
jgi:hypothetical protein